MASGASRSANTSDRWACSSRRRRQLNRYGMHNLGITLAKRKCCALVLHMGSLLCRRQPAADQAMTTQKSRGCHSSEQAHTRSWLPCPRSRSVPFATQSLHASCKLHRQLWCDTIQVVWGMQDDHQGHESGSDLSEEENSDAVSGPPSRPADEQPSISCSEDEEAKGTAQGTMAVCHTPATGPAAVREQARPASAESGPSGSMPGSRKRGSVQDCELSENESEPHGGSKRRSLGRASPSDEAIASDAALQAAASPLARR